MAMKKNKPKPTTEISVEYVITHRVVLTVEENDVDSQVDIVGLTLASHGKSNYEGNKEKSIRDTKIAYKYTKSGTIS